MNKDLKFLMQLAKNAAKLITTDIQVKAKDNNGDLVTNFDYEIENYINGKIKKQYPTFDIISEEFNCNNKLTDNCFTVDPIDGTINFAHDLPLYGIQLACIKNSKVIAAVIYLPKLKEMYYADEQHAYLNEKVIHVNNLPESKSLYSVQGPSEYKWPGKIEMNKISPNGRDSWSSAVDFAWTAEGVLGGVIFTKDTYWDFVPGQHIVKMAGGYILDKPGAHIAANSKALAELLEKHATYNKKK